MTRYLDANMHTGAVGWAVYSSLASFWPGVQVLYIYICMYVYIYIMYCVPRMHTAQGTEL